MIPDLWRYPGPMAFVTKIARDLGSGCHVIAGLPTWLTSSTLHREVKELLFRDTDTYLHRVHLTQLEEESGVPEAALIRRFEFPAAPAGVSDLDHLAAVAAHQAFWLVGIEELPPLRQRRWLDWLAAYVAKTKDQEATTYPVFCLVIGGTVEHPAFERDIKLRLHQWWNELSRAEVALLAEATLLGASERSFDLAMAVEVAGSDVDLLVELSYIDLCDLRAVDQTLNTVMHGRGYDGLITLAREAIDRAPVQHPGFVSHADWEPSSPVERKLIGLGLLEAFRGESPRPSTLALRLAGDVEGVRRRIWYGQLATLLPEIDDMRGRLIAYLTRRFGNGWMAWFEREVDRRRNPEELEVGDLVHLFRCARVHLQDVDPAVGQAIEWLRDVRNQLAHLETVSPEMLAHARGALATTAEILDEGRSRTQAPETSPTRSMSSV